MTTVKEIYINIKASYQQFVKGMKQVESGLFNVQKATQGVSEHMQKVALKIKVGSNATKLFRNNLKKLKNTAFRTGAKFKEFQNTFQIPSH